MTAWVPLPVEVQCRLAPSTLAGDATRDTNNRIARAATMDTLRLFILYLRSVPAPSSPIIEKRRDRSARRWRGRSLLYHDSAPLRYLSRIPVDSVSQGPSHLRRRASPRSSPSS